MAKALVHGSPTHRQRSHDTTFLVQMQQTSWHFNLPDGAPFIDFSSLQLSICVPSMSLDYMLGQSASSMFNCSKAH